MVRPRVCTSRKDILSQVGADTDTKTKRTAAAKQKRRPGTAGEAIVIIFSKSYSSLLTRMSANGIERQETREFTVDAVVERGREDEGGE